MASLEIGEPPACPFLGLVTDPRSHFTYPHPAHRCFAANRPVTADVRRQTTYCLSLDFETCDRYVAWQRKAVTAGPSRSSRADGEASAQGSAGPSVDGVARSTVVHAFRTGDTLTRIAARYGLTVDEIATANRLAPNQPVADGTRLVIPLRETLAPQRAGRRTNLGG
jgi:LysM repeat protein